MNDFNPISFREQFPALHTIEVYLDNAASTPKPQCVIDAVTQFYSYGIGTVHRSHFPAALAVTAEYEQTRSKVARWINAPDASTIVWTRGTTEAINLVAYSWLQPRLRAGDKILVSEAEHHANLVPWLMLAQRCGARIVKWPIGRDMLPDMALLPDLLSARTRLMALGQMSNVTGGRPALAEAITLAHQKGARVMIDGAQGIVHTDTDVQALDIDFYAFSSHKLYGPMGIGVLYGKPELLDEMPPWHGGGKMLTQVDFSGFTPQAVPWRFEAGTPNVAGLGVTLDWLRKCDLAGARRHSRELADLAQDQLNSLPGFRSFRAADSCLLSFDIAGLHHQDVVMLLAEKGIALRAGQHCAQPLMKALGVTGTLRASFAPYNTGQDVAKLVSALHSTVKILTDK